MTQSPRYAAAVTIVIPTMNRARFLETYVRALAATGYAGRVLICDSSNDTEFALAERLLAAVGAEFPIIHRHLPGLGNAQAVDAALADITTPYAIYMPDDDILVPRTMEMAANFLEGHPDYGAATGHAVIVPVKDGQIPTSTAYPLRSFEQDSPAERLASLFADYSVVHYAVTRTADLRHCWHVGARINERFFSGELLINSLQLIRGKVGRVDSLLVVRQDHPTRVSQQDFFDWVVSEGWGDGARQFLDIVSGALSEASGLSGDAARQVVKRAFSTYLARNMTRLSGRLDQNPGQAGLRDRLRRIGWLRALVRTGRSHAPGETGQFTLEALLRPGSRFHSDFMPVYNALTTNDPPRSPS